MSFPQGRSPALQRTHDLPSKSGATVAVNYVALERHSAQDGKSQFLGE
jgi:hypothetical protein